MLRLIMCIALLSAVIDVTQGTLRKLPKGLTIHKGSVTWEEARDECQRKGGVLASPINTTSLNAMKSVMGAYSTTYFIGTKATDVPGQFVSIEGVALENMPLAVTLDMVQQLDQREGDCLAMSRDSIRAVPCWSKLPYMCMYGTRAPNTYATDCGPAEEGGVLASPINTTSLNAMKSVMGAYSTTYFIGTKATDVPGQFVSIEGVALENMPLAVTLDMVQQLDQREGDCLAMSRDSIRAVPCWSKLPYMCMYGTRAPNTYATDCGPAEEGGVLASPINTTSLNAMKSVMGAYSTTYFIGTKATDVPGQFVSIEGVALENMPLAVTLDMVQQLDQREGDCLAMSRDSIRAVPCWSKLPYMCMYGTRAPNTYATDCGPAEEGYKYDITTGHCYKLHTEARPWDVAHWTCLSEGGHLAVVENEEEAQIIKSLDTFTYDVHIFIGRHKMVGKSGWMSIYGQPVEELYNVVPGTRSATDNEFQCGGLHESGQWQYVRCDAYAHFVCQKEPNISLL